MGNNFYTCPLRTVFSTYLSQSSSFLDDRPGIERAFAWRVCLRKNHGITRKNRKDTTEIALKTAKTTGEKRIKSIKSSFFVIISTTPSSHVTTVYTVCS